MVTIKDVVQEVREEFNKPDLSPPLVWGDERWDKFARAIEGWKSGLFWIAGQTNHGKSSAVITFVLNLLEHNPNLRIIDFSVDDDRFTRIARYVANIARVDQNIVKYQGIKFPDPFSNDGHSRNGEELDWSINDAINEAYDRLIAFDDRLMVYDPATIVRDLYPDKWNAARDVNLMMEVADITDVIRIVQREVQLEEERGEDKRDILVVVDSFYDLTMRKHHGDEFSRQEKLVGALAALARKLSIRILSTGHINKRENMKKPSIDSLSGHRMIRYTATIVAFLYTPQVDDSTATDMQYYDVAENRTYPVTCFTFQKNKAGVYHGTFYFAQDMACSRLIMLPENVQNNFREALS